MLIAHQTSQNAIKSIINDGYIYPSKKTNNLNQGSGIYTNSPYVFANAIPNDMNVIKRMLDTTILFDSSILIGKTFYTNINHSGGNTKSSMRHKYNSKKKIDHVLLKLYKQSIEREKIMKDMQPFPYFTVSQELFFKKSLPILKAKYIVFDDKIINLINNKYPDIQIITSRDYFSKIRSKQKGGYDYRYKYSKYKYLYLHLLNNN